MKERRSVNKREVVDVSVSLAWYGSVTTEATMHLITHTMSVSIRKRKKFEENFELPYEYYIGVQVPVPYE